MVYKAPKSRRKWLYAAGAVGLVIVVLAILELTNVINLFHSSPPPPATGPVTKGEVSSSSDTAATNSSGGSTSSSPNQKTDGSSEPTTTLAPDGTFVSNHRPNLSGQPTPNSLTSTCTTNPGITCQISFTMNGVTKSLPAKTTDAQGSAYWNWTLQSIGLTEGTWSIQATASHNGDVKTSTDAQALVVAQ